MRLRAFTTLLVAIVSLISTLSCSKQKDPTPATTFGTGSYKLDGISRNCQVQAIVVTSSTAPASDNLKLLLTTENSPSQEYLLLEFNKLSSQPNAAYTLITMAYFPVGSGYGTLYDNDVTTLMATSDGSFSGTFSGKTTTTVASGATVQHTIAAGTFTGVHP